MSETRYVVTKIEKCDCDAYGTESQAYMMEGDLHERYRAVCSNCKGRGEIRTEVDLMEVIGTRKHKALTEMV